MSNTATVLEILQHAVGSMSAAEIADKCGLTTVQVAGSLQYLVAHNPAVSRESRGRFAYDPPEGEFEAERSLSIKRRAEAAAAEAAVATHPANGHVNGNGNGNGVGTALADAPPIDLRELRAEPAPARGEIVVEVPEPRPIVVRKAELPSDTPALFEAVTVDRDSNLVLQDEQGNLWLAVPLRPVMPGTNRSN